MSTLSNSLMTLQRWARSSAVFINNFTSRIEIPEFRRCCGCIPLRYGLLIWGYVKLLLYSCIIYEVISDLKVYSRLAVFIQSFIGVVISSTVCLDYLINILFILAGHCKFSKLYQMSYYYSLVFLSILVFVMINFIIFNWQMLELYIVFRFIVTAYLPTLLSQLYITLLTRTEAKKLINNSRNFEFANQVPEATVAMNTENGVLHDVQIDTSDDVQVL